MTLVYKEISEMCVQFVFYVWRYTSKHIAYGEMNYTWAIVTQNTPISTQKLF